MIRFQPLALLFATAGFCLSAVPPNNDAFEMKVRPVFAKACYGCHTDAAMGGLRLDTRDLVLKEVVPGNPDASKLIQAVRYDGARKMPPGGKLKAEEIAALEAWVKAGAVWPENAKPATAKSAPYIITQEQRNFW